MVLEYKISQIKTRTLMKLAVLSELSMEQDKFVTVPQIMQALRCCYTTAYRYRIALECLKFYLEDI